MPELSEIGHGRIGGYANTFLPVPTDWKSYPKDKLDPSDWKSYEAAALPLRDDLDPPTFAAHARQWLSLGATVIGGCCGAGPDHIASLRRLIDDTGALH